MKEIPFTSPDTINIGDFPAQLYDLRGGGSGKEINLNVFDDNFYAQVEKHKGTWGEKEYKWEFATSITADTFEELLLKFKQYVEERNV